MRNISGVTGVVLAGGASRRMGQDKALLVWQGQTLLSRTVDCLSSLCDEIIVVGPERDVQLAPCARVVADILPNSGPLGGLYTGMREARNSVVLALACDLPHVHAGALTRLLDLLGDLSPASPPGDRSLGRYISSDEMHGPTAVVPRGPATDTEDRTAPAESPMVPCVQEENPIGGFDAVVPLWNGRIHPLHAVYRRSVVDIAEEHLQRGRHRMDDFCHDLHTLYATADSFDAVDPTMITLTNVNTEQEYGSELARPASLRDR